MDKLGKNIVFKFYSAKEFLKEFYKLKKESNHRWSYNVWCRDLKIKDPSILRKACQGSRSISPDLEKKLSNYFNFNIREAKHFHAIVAYSEFQKVYPQVAPNLISSFEKESYVNKYDKFELDQFRSMNNWWDYCLRCLSHDYPLTEENLKIIATSLVIPVEFNDLKKSVKRMLDSGLLIEKNGKPFRSLGNTEFSIHSVVKKELEKLHLANLDISKIIVGKSMEEGFAWNTANSLTMVMESSNFKAMAAELAVAIKKVLEQFENKNGDVLIQHINQSFVAANIEKLKK